MLFVFFSAYADFKLAGQAYTSTDRRSGYSPSEPQAFVASSDSSRVLVYSPIPTDVPPTAAQFQIDFPGALIFTSSISVNV